MIFFSELILGWLAQSAGLTADSLDMLADAAVYGISLYAVGRALSLQRQAARLSGYMQLMLAGGVLFEVGRRFIFGSEPEAPFMIVVSCIGGKRDLPLADIKPPRRWRSHAGKLDFFR